MPGLQACPNGPRRPDEHPAVPVTPRQCAAAAAAAVAAGADDLHLHPKAPDGRDSLLDEHVAPLLRAVRAAVPGVPVGVTTGEWALADPTGVAASVAAWSERPDHASVNWHEAGVEETVAALVGSGVRVDAGLWTLDAARAWAGSPLRAATARVLLELPDDHDVEALAVAMLAVVRPHADVVLLHGEGRSAWPALDLAVRWGLGTRAGLEDTLLLPDGSPAVDGADVVRAAVARSGRPDPSPSY